MNAKICLLHRMFCVSAVRLKSFYVEILELRPDRLIIIIIIIPSIPRNVDWAVAHAKKPPSLFQIDFVSLVLQFPYIVT